MKLVIKSGQYEGVTVDVVTPFNIGRAQDASLFLADPQVSRRHSLITFDQGQYWVEDAGSHNGTFVNEIKVEGKRVLRSGDILRTGNTKLEIQSATGETGRHAIAIEDEGTQVTMTVERSARDLTPPTLEVITSELMVEGFTFPNIDDLRRASDRSLALVLSNAKRFAILFHVARALQQSTDMERLLAAVMDHLFRVLKADRCDVVLQAPETGELVPVLAVDREGKTLETVKISRTVVSKVINGRVAIISTNAAADPRLASSESVIMYGMKSIMCAPMISREKVLGVIQVTNEKNMAAFGDEDLYLLTVISSLAAVAIENGRLYEQQAKALADLKRANDELITTQNELIHQEKLATVGQMASGIAHEIRNTLGPIALVHLLKERHPDDDVLQEYAALILESHNRILSIIGEVKNYTTGQKPQQSQVEVSRHNLKVLLESVTNFLKFDKDVKRAEVTLTATENLYANVNLDRIKQVVINLVRNAAQAVPERGGKIRVELAKQGEEAVISVTDNGCGIPEENLEMIWKPFFTTKKDTGMGLGLDICRMIIEQHSGHIECKSQVGKGTTMSVRLKLTPQQAA